MRVANRSTNAHAHSHHSGQVGGTEKRLTENWKRGMNTESEREREILHATQRDDEMALARIGDGNFCRSPPLLEQDVAGGNRDRKCVQCILINA